MEFSVQVTQKVSSKRVADILVGAFEGGSTYWIEEVLPGPEVSGFGSKKAGDDDYYPRTIRYPLSGGYIEVRVSEDPDPTKKYRLDQTALKRGLETMAAKYQKHWANLVGDNDDAETADVFLQCCLFGEIVYG